MNLRRAIAPAITAALLLFIGVRDGWRISPVPGEKFVVAAAIPPRADEDAVFHEQFVDPTFTRPSAHVSSLCQLDRKSVV